MSKVKITVRLPKDLVQRLREYVYVVGGVDRVVTSESFITDAIKDALDRGEKEHNLKAELAKQNLA